VASDRRAVPRARGWARDGPAGPGKGGGGAFLTANTSEAPAKEPCKTSITASTATLAKALPPGTGRRAGICTPAKLSFSEQMATLAPSNFAR
jgi:hypothetical protein